MTEAVEQHEFDRPRDPLLIETQRADKFVATPLGRHRSRQAGALNQALKSRRAARREAGVFAGQPRRRDHSNGDSLTVKVAAVAGARFDRMTDGVAEVQSLA